MAKQFSLLAFITLTLTFASGQSLPCEYSGPLFAKNGSIVRFSSDTMKHRAMKRAEVGGITLRQADFGRIEIVVDVLVDSKGEVICAKAINGHPIIRADVQNAVGQWTFRTVRQKGVPVAYLGRLRFSLCRMFCGKKGESVTLLR
jgi:hypothetical protein